MSFEPSHPVADAALHAIGGVQTIERSSRSVTVTGTGDLAASLINALTAAGIRVANLEARRNSLDEAFIRLTGDADSAGSQEASA